MLNLRISRILDLRLSILCLLIAAGNVERNLKELCSLLELHGNLIMNFIMHGNLRSYILTCDGCLKGCAKEIVRDLLIFGVLGFVPNKSLVKHIHMSLQR